MADTKCSSSKPRRRRNDDFNLVARKKRKIAKGKDTLGVDCATSQLELADIAINVVSLLGLRDVFTLGSCSKFLNELCECESTWKLLYIRRWGDPLSDIKAESPRGLPLTAKGWKHLYISKHKKMASVVSKIIQSIMRYIINGIYVDYNFFRAANQMKASNVTFEDIYFFFFRRDISILVNFVALFYSYFCLHVPMEDIEKAVVSRQLADRVVCIRWTCPQNRDHGINMPEENYTEINSLGNIAKLETDALYLFKRQTQNHIHDVVISDLSISSVIPRNKAKTCRLRCARSAITTSSCI